MAHGWNRIGVAVSIICAILLAACGAQANPSVPATDSTSVPSNPTASTGPVVAGDETLSIAWEGDIASLDPTQAYDYISWPGVRMIFETLVSYGDSVELEPWLAAAMPEMSADGLTYTFTLRDGVNFVLGDGSIHREMTADDVVYSLNRMLDPDLVPTPSPVSGSFFTIIEGAQAVVDGEAKEATGIVARDDRTVEITLVQPDRTFLNILAMPFASVVPADLATEDTVAFAADPVGTGPYTLESYVIGEKAIFNPNAHYWGDAPSNGGVEMRFGVDANTAVQQVEANQLDIMGDPVPAGVITSLRDNPDYADRIRNVEQVAVSYLSIDTTAPDGGPLADVRVRQAMNHAIDKENILQLMRGRGVVADCIYPPELPGHNPDCAPYDHDPGRARDLLDEAGYGDGFSTTVYTDPSEDSTAIVQAIQQDFDAVGIDLEIVTQEFDVLIGTITVPHEAPLVYIGWFQDFPDPSDFYDPILSCAAAEGGFNTSWYCNEEADAIAAEARGLSDLDDRLAMYQDVEELVMADAPWVPIIFPSIETFLSERVTHFAPHPVWLVDLAKYSVAD